MKNNTLAIFTLFLGLSLPALQSCEGWLEATSSSQISDKMLFSSRSGFHEALSGVYIQMGEKDTYGANYTWFFNELVCGPYSSSESNALFRGITQHLYNVAVVNPYIENMWKGGYSIISNVNKTLQELENHRDIVADEVEYRLIKGELLAIRAYVHFDLMRMYGPSSWSGDKAGLLAIPYVREYSAEPTPQLSISETVDLLRADISDALECLEVDPVLGVKSENFDEYVNADGYWTDRQKHINYYAVLALSARVNLWRRDFVTAGREASQVIAGAQSASLVKWLDVDAFLEQTQYIYRDWTFSCEHLFSLEVTDLYDNLKRYYFPDPNSGGILFDEQAVVGFFPFIPELGIDDLSEDVRGPAGLLHYTSSGYQIYKFYSSDGYFRAYRNRMPMIRLSEMHLILAEAAIQAFDLNGAINELDTIRRHRGITTSLSTWINTVDSQYARTEVISELMQEYLRETMGEGQYLYACRRIAREYNQQVFVGPALMTLLRDSDIVYPYPVAETTYGRKQEL